MYVIIVGCGRVGALVGTLMSEEGHNVVVIDRKQESFRRLSGNFNGLTVLGNGFELDVLRRAGIEKADAFCALTNGDNTNIMASQVARKVFKVPRVVARVYDSARADIYAALGLEVLSGTVLFASMIRDKLLDPRLSSYLIERPGLGVIEMEVGPAVAGKTVADVSLPSEFLVASVLKKQPRPGRDAVIPSGDTRLEAGDKVYGIVKTGSIKKVEKIFGVS